MRVMMATINILSKTEERGKVNAHICGFCNVEKDFPCLIFDYYMRE